MSYDPRFDRYRSPNVKRPKQAGDSLPDSFAARTGWEKPAKPRSSGSFGRSPQQTAASWGRPGERLKRSKFRLWAVWAVLMLGGLGLAVNLFYLQVTRAPALRKQAEQQQTLKTKPFVPRRPIIDRAGNVLAIDRQVYTLYAHPKLFNHSKAEIAAKLAPMLAIERSPGTTSEAELIRRFNLAESGITIAESLPQEVADRIAQMQIKDSLVDGLELLRQQQRFYPQQELAADILGYVDGERKGQAGVEYSQQNLLERSMPSIQFSRSSNGNWVPDRLTAGFVQLDDLKLQLTIDSRLQRAARIALKEKMKQHDAKRGTVIVMDARNGELLSVVAEPSYDPNQYFNFDLSRYKNWAVTDVYEPGSTFKAINVAIAMEAGAVKPNTVFKDEGRIYMDGWTIQNSDYKQAGARGPSTVTEILKHSSNVGMVHVMRSMKASLYYQALEKLGLGQTAGTDLPFEVTSQLKNREQFINSPVEVATTAFGQGFSITPIQLVQLNGALANGGKLVTPHVVRGLFDRNGEAYWKLPRPVPKQVFSPETTKQVLEMMETVVDGGTGKAAQIPGYRIAGKTGTAQKANAGGGYSDKAIITSFVGIMPVEAPRYVVLAVIDEPKDGSGGTVAAPIVESVMEALISIEKIAPSKK
ncbi:penicillin-binding protein transpeptidase [Oscillatoria nigro-viridis PCC 7112]|uniref:Penicillin-binding protein transpeptidase n=1 Tax=Phormidium nigroviride PCC 7112 TaxID=179408 RepID=K9VK49_9CYAN|nr:penicillin-binding protein 2 [Oscillatoria nigro-viridis]AFZ08468.1 penicillin-binding protein transpeptidase [Oscillatoria nigro-viridis PCC 7112]